MLSQDLAPFVDFGLLAKAVAENNSALALEALHVPGREGLFFPGEWWRVLRSLDVSSLSSSGRITKVKGAMATWKAFWDGVSLSSSPGLETWTEAERARLSSPLDRPLDVSLVMLSPGAPLHDVTNVSPNVLLQRAAEAVMAGARADGKALVPLGPTDLVDRVVRTQSSVCGSNVTSGALEAAWAISKFALLESGAQFMSRLPLPATFSAPQTTDPPRASDISSTVFFGLQQKKYEGVLHDDVFVRRSAVHVLYNVDVERNPQNLVTGARVEMYVFPDPKIPKIIQACRHGWVYRNDVGMIVCVASSHPLGGSRDRSPTGPQSLPRSTVPSWATHSAFLEDRNSASVPHTVSYVCRQTRVPEFIESHKEVHLPNGGVQSDIGSYFDPRRQTEPAATVLPMALPDDCPMLYSDDEASEGGEADVEFVRHEPVSETPATLPAFRPPPRPERSPEGGGGSDSNEPFSDDFGEDEYGVCEEGGGLGEGDEDEEEEEEEEEESEESSSDEDYVPERRGGGKRKRKVSLAAASAFVDDIADSGGEGGEAATPEDRARKAHERRFRKKFKVGSKGYLKTGFVVDSDEEDEVSQLDDNSSESDPFSDSSEASEMRLDPEVARAQTRAGRREKKPEGELSSENLAIVTKCHNMIVNPSRFERDDDLAHIDNARAIASAHDKWKQARAPGARPAELRKSKKMLLTLLELTSITSHVLDQGGTEDEGFEEDGSDTDEEMEGPGTGSRQRRRRKKPDFVTDGLSDRQRQRVIQLRDLTRVDGTDMPAFRARPLPAPSSLPAALPEQLQDLPGLQRRSKEAQDAASLLLSSVATRTPAGVKIALAALHALDGDGLVLLAVRDSFVWARPAQIALDATLAAMMRVSMVVELSGLMACLWLLAHHCPATFGSTPLHRDVWQLIFVCADDLAASGAATRAPWFVPAELAINRVMTAVPSARACVAGSVWRARLAVLSSGEGAGQVASTGIARRSAALESLLADRVDARGRALHTLQGSDSRLPTSVAPLEGTPPDPFTATLPWRGGQEQDPTFGSWLAAPGSCVDNDDGAQGLLGALVTTPSLFRPEKKTFIGKWGDAGRAVVYVCCLSAHMSSDERSFPGHGGVASLVARHPQRRAALARALKRRAGVDEEEGEGEGAGKGRRRSRPSRGRAKAAEAGGSKIDVSKWLAPPAEPKHPLPLAAFDPSLGNDHVALEQLFCGSTVVLDAATDGVIKPVPLASSQATGANYFALFDGRARAVGSGGEALAAAANFQAIALTVLPPSARRAPLGHETFHHAWLTGASQAHAAARSLQLAHNVVGVANKRGTDVSSPQFSFERLQSRGTSVPGAAPVVPDGSTLGREGVEALLQSTLVHLDTAVAQFAQNLVTQKESQMPEADPDPAANPGGARRRTTGPRWNQGAVSRLQFPPRDRPTVPTLSPLASGLRAELQQVQVLAACLSPAVCAAVARSGVLAYPKMLLPAIVANIAIGQDAAPLAAAACSVPHLCALLRDLLELPAVPLFSVGELQAVVAESFPGPVTGPPGVQGLWVDHSRARAESRVREVRARLRALADGERGDAWCDIVRQELRSQPTRPLPGREPVPADFEALQVSCVAADPVASNCFGAARTVPDLVVPPRWSRTAASPPPEFEDLVRWFHLGGKPHVATQVLSVGLSARNGGSLLLVGRTTFAQGKKRFVSREDTATVTVAELAALERLERGAGGGATLTAERFCRSVGWDPPEEGDEEEVDPSSLDTPRLSVALAWLRPWAKVLWSCACAEDPNVNKPRSRQPGSPDIGCTCVLFRVLCATASAALASSRKSGGEDADDDELVDAQDSVAVVRRPDLLAVRHGHEACFKACGLPGQRDLPATSGSQVFPPEETTPGEKLPFVNCAARLKVLEEKPSVSLAQGAVRAREAASPARFALSRAPWAASHVKGTVYPVKAAGKKKKYFSLESAAWTSDWLPHHTRRNRDERLSAADLFTAERLRGMAEALVELVTTPAYLWRLAEGLQLGAADLVHRASKQRGQRSDRLPRLHLPAGHCLAQVVCFLSSLRVLAWQPEGPEGPEGSGCWVAGPTTLAPTLAYLAAALRAAVPGRPDLEEEEEEETAGVVLAGDASALRRTYSRLLDRGVNRHLLRLALDTVAVDLDRVAAGELDQVALEAVAPVATGEAAPGQAARKGAWTRSLRRSLLLAATSSGLVFQNAGGGGDLLAAVTVWTVSPGGRRGVAVLARWFRELAASLVCGGWVVAGDLAPDAKVEGEEEDEADDLAAAEARFAAAEEEKAVATAVPPVVRLAARAMAKVETEEGLLLRGGDGGSPPCGGWLRHGASDEELAATVRELQATVPRTGGTLVVTSRAAMHRCWTPQHARQRVAWIDSPEEAAGTIAGCGEGGSGFVHAVGQDLGFRTAFQLMRADVVVVTTEWIKYSRGNWGRLTQLRWQRLVLRVESPLDLLTVREEDLRGHDHLLLEFATALATDASWLSTPGNPPVNWVPVQRVAPFARLLLHVAGAARETADLLPPRVNALVRGGGWAAWLAGARLLTNRDVTEAVAGHALTQKLPPSVAGWLWDATGTAHAARCLRWKVWPARRDAKKPSPARLREFPRGAVLVRRGAMPKQLRAARASAASRKTKRGSAEPEPEPEPEAQVEALDPEFLTAAEFRGVLVAAAPGAEEATEDGSVRADALAFFKKLLVSAAGALPDEKVEVGRALTHAVQLVLGAVMSSASPAWPEPFASAHPLRPTRAWALWLRQCVAGGGCLLELRSWTRLQASCDRYLKRDWLTGDLLEMFGWPSRELLARQGPRAARLAATRAVWSAWAGGPSTEELLNTVAFRRVEPPASSNVKPAAWTQRWERGCSSIWLMLHQGTAGAKGLAGSRQPWRASKEDLAALRRRAPSSESTSVGLRASSATEELRSAAVALEQQKWVVWLKAVKTHPGSEDFAWELTAEAVRSLVDVDALLSTREQKNDARALAKRCVKLAVKRNTWVGVVCESEAELERAVARWPDDPRVLVGRLDDLRPQLVRLEGVAVPLVRARDACAKKKETAKKKKNVEEEGGA
jgi:hypothetical protein